MTEDRLLSTKEAAIFIGVRPQTMERWRYEGDHPLTYVRFNAKLIRYRMSDIISWIKAHEVSK